MKGRKDMGEEPIGMTQLEQQLKQCFLSRPDIQNHILTAEELGAYIGWMVETFGGKVRLDSSELASTQNDTALGKMGRRILENPNDKQALKAITEGYATQQEERYIISDHDISTSQILRYMPAHWHNNEYFEVYYANSGDCPVYFPNETVHLKTGAVMIVAPKMQHATPCYHDEAVLTCYSIRSSTFEKVFWNQIPSENLLATFFRRALDGTVPNSYLHFETNADPDIARLLRQIYHEHMDALPYNAQMMNALMTACFLLLLRRYEGTARLPRTENFFWRHEYSALLSHIQSQFATTNLTELSRRFHYSEKQIRRVVQTCTGESYSDLIARLKMERAAALLRQGASMEAISSTIGYTTVSSFYRAFTKFYGCTPGNFS